MSSVCSMILTTACIEDEADGGLVAFHAWCACPTDLGGKPIEFRELDLDPAVNHSKGMEINVYAAAGNYYDYDALIAAFPKFPWLLREEALLVVYPPHGWPVVVRGDGRSGSRLAEHE